MSLISRNTEYWAVLLALLAPLLVVGAWGHLRGPRPVKLLQRVTLVGFGQLLAVMATFVVVNHQYVFYASWSELLGTESDPHPLVTHESAAYRGPLGQVNVFHAVTTALKGDGGGNLVTETVTGPLSHVTAKVIVSLPPEYSEAQYRHRAFPVVEFMTGWRGNPESWDRGLHLYQKLRELRASRRGTPFIAVIPALNVAIPRDAECTDIPGGVKAQTWLTSDVRTLMTSQFRALDTPGSWGAVGYSTGGYCAVKFALVHPEWYRYAAALGGYYSAIKDSTTGDLWGGSQAYRNENDPGWRVQHLPRPLVHLLIFSSQKDRDSYRPTEEFLHVVTPPVDVTSFIARKGGHNASALASVLPQFLDWMATHLEVSGQPGPPGAPALLGPALIG